MSIEVTQKSYKVSASGPWAFSSHSYTSGPSACTSSLTFFLYSGQQQQLPRWPGNQRRNRSRPSTTFASFINEVWLLERQNKMLETRWSLLQQQKMAQMNTDRIMESSINVRRQLHTLGQEKLKLEAEYGNTPGLVEDFKNKYKDKINNFTEG
ncbi:Keratin, type II cytoskeletal 8 [Plecturocebus cupreus]